MPEPHELCMRVGGVITGAATTRGHPWQPGPHQSLSDNGAQSLTWPCPNFFDALQRRPRANRSSAVTQSLGFDKKRTASPSSSMRSTESRRCRTRGYGWQGVCGVRLGRVGWSCVWCAQALWLAAAVTDDRARSKQRGIQQSTDHIFRILSGSGSSNDLVTPEDPL